MFKWYITINGILKNEPEVWLNYLKGQKLNDFPHFIDKKPPHSGLVKQLIKIPYQLVRLSKNNSQFKTKESSIFDYYMYAGSSNQLNSLTSTALALKQQGQLVNFTTYDHLIPNTNHAISYTILSLTLLDVLKSLMLTILHGPRLFKELLRIDPIIIKYWFAEFCLTYPYLVYFERILSDNKPELVITSNDHNVQNRCLLAVASKLNIKTAYIQHASVSNLFPALTVDYAFLDGNSSLDTYKQCSNNLIKTNLKPSHTTVFLSGQKKILYSKVRNDANSIKVIGIAVNSLDNINNVIELAKYLIDLDLKVVIRWHPAQSPNDINRIKKSLNQLNLISFSDSKHELVSDFLNRITWLIAGNSSIHLEAALAGVNTLYYETSHQTKPDYYGYVKAGLALSVSGIEDIPNIVLAADSFNEQNIKTREKAIKYYSSTYNTEWEGKEGKLVSECLIAIKNGTPPPIKAQIL